MDYDFFPLWFLIGPEEALGHLSLMFDNHLHLDLSPTVLKYL